MKRAKWKCQCGKKALVYAEWYRTNRVRWFVVGDTKHWGNLRLPGIMLGEWLTMKKFSCIQPGVYCHNCGRYFGSRQEFREFVDTGLLTTSDCLELLR
jgi:hypothetical protein